MAVLDKVSKGAKIRNRYNQVPHLTQDTNGKVTSFTIHSVITLQFYFYGSRGLIESDNIKF